MQMTQTRSNRKRSFVQVKSMTKKTSSLHLLSLRLKMRRIHLDVQHAQFDPIVINEKLDHLAQCVWLLHLKGILIPEQRGLECLRVVQRKIEHALLHRKEHARLFHVARISSEQRWQLVRRQFQDECECFDLEEFGCISPIERERMIIGRLEKRTIESLLDEIEMLLETLHAARKEGIAHWNLNRMDQAIPYLLTADRCTKLILQKKQQVSIDQTLLLTTTIVDGLIESKRERHHEKTITTKQVSFQDKVHVLGHAQGNYDRKAEPSSPKPSKLEILLIRSARYFPW